MHSLAIALKKNGHQVTGSDDTIFDPSLTQLQKAEICPEQMGWYPEKINKNLDAVIVGMHAKKIILNCWLHKKRVCHFFPTPNLLPTMPGTKLGW